MIYIYIILSFMGTYLAFINIYNFNQSKNTIFINFMTISISLIVLYKYLKICPIFIFNILLSLISYQNTKKILISFIIPLVSTMTYLTVSMIFYFIIFLLFDESVYSQFNLIYIVLYCLISYIGTYILSKYLNNNVIKIIGNVSILMKFKVQALVLINVILTFIIHFESTVQIKILKSMLVTEKYNPKLLILYFITFLSFILVILIINNQRKLIQIKNYNDRLEEMTSDIQKFKHDYKNILITMREYIEKEDINGLRRFYNDNIEYLDKNIQINNLSIVSLKKVKNIELKGILSSKIIKAEGLKIKVKIDILNHIEDINMNIIDCCRVLGIIIDNCIEASLECEVPEIDISITKNEYKTSFIISNNYKYKIDNISNLFKEGFSTKGKNRGIGLSSLKCILKGYDNIHFNINVKENFVQQLDIYN